MSSSPDVTGLQGLVTAEQAAAYGIAAMGGRLANLAPASPGLAVLRQLFDTHRLRRDAWSDALRARSAAVPTAAPAYALPPLGTPTQVLGAAAALEGRAAGAYQDALRIVADASLRTQLVAALTDAARRRYALGTLAGEPAATAATALPGGQAG